LQTAFHILKMHWSTEHATLQVHKHWHWKSIIL